MRVEIYMRKWDNGLDVPRQFQEYHAEADAGLYEKVFDGEVPGTDRELIYAACNSYPEEMHVSEDWLDFVRVYRAQKLRSLSVGDIVVIDAPATVQRMGFADIPVELLPTLV